MSLMSVKDVLSHFLVAMDTQNCPVITEDFAVAVFSSPEGKKIELSNRRYVDNKKNQMNILPPEVKRKEKDSNKTLKNNDSFTINVIFLALAL